MQLFKYQKIDEYSLDGLSNGTHYFCSPDRFNDPFEFHVPDQVCTIQFAALHYAKTRNPENIPPNVFDAIKDEVLRNMPLQVGIVSLSKRGDNPLMWGHYTDKHKGMCLQFAYSGNGDELYDVNYEPVPPIISNIDADLWDVENALQFAFTKHKDWDYEEEIRLLDTPPNSSAPYNANFTLESVIFGMKSSEADQLLVRDALKNKPVKFLKAQKSTSTFDIVFEEC